MELRPYQQEAKEAVFEQWENGTRRTLLVLPTGCGKTIVFAKITEDCVRHGDRVLILAHRGELLEQAADKIHKATGLGCAVEKAEESCQGSWFRIVVGSVQTLMREKRLGRFPADYFNTIIIDEAQFVPGIGRVIKRMVDSNHAGCRLFVTGSSSLELAGGMKESAAGRFNTYNLWPFSLEELAAHTSWIEVKRQIQDRMIYGCCPAVVNEPQHAKQYLLDFADAVLYKDLFKLAEMRKPTELVKLVKYLAYNVGSEVKYATVASELGIQNKTIERYVDLLEACFIIKTVPSLSRNPQSEIKLGKKIYFYDNGIRNALIRDFSPLPVRTDAGALWENLFFTERLKHHAFRCDGAEIYFWRTRAKHEVDFLEVLNGKVRAFECKSSAKSKTTSIKAFERAYPETKVAIATPNNIDVIANDERLTD